MLARESQWANAADDDDDATPSAPPLEPGTIPGVREEEEGEEEEEEARANRAATRAAAAAAAERRRRERGEDDAKGTAEGEKEEAEEGTRAGATGGSAGSTGILRLDVDADGVPKNFVCPITQELFHDPVIWVDGHSYERDAIARWLRNSEKSPMTGERHRGARDVLQPNHAMRSQVEEWRGQHPNARIGRPKY